MKIKKLINFIMKVQRVVNISQVKFLNDLYDNQQ